MSRFLARRHQRLMDESEHALQEASHSNSDCEARVSRQILGDQKMHTVWESRHADLLVPVAEYGRPARQIVMLRLMATKLVHGRAIIEYIRDQKIRGTERRRFFAYYFPQLDFDRAVLAAHRYYLMSMSSMVSTWHLIELTSDPVSKQLLHEYRDIYKQYFELSSFKATSDDELCGKALQPLIEGAQIQLRQVRRKLSSAPPHNRCRELEKQACIARSGRYPVLNYMVG